jgi:hypothetical protein
MLGPAVQARPHGVQSSVTSFGSERARPMRARCAAPRQLGGTVGEHRRVRPPGAADDARQTARRGSRQAAAAHRGGSDHDPTRVEEAQPRSDGHQPSVGLTRARRRDGTSRRAATSRRTARATTLAAACSSTTSLAVREPRHHSFAAATEHAAPRGDAEAAWLGGVGRLHRPTAWADPRDQHELTAG